MCEAQSPPTVGSNVYIVWPPQKGEYPRVGEEFTEPWGAYDVTFRVENDRGPGKYTGGRRLDCTVTQTVIREDT